MNYNDILKKYEISAKELRSFIAQWGSDYSAIAYFLDEGYLLWPVHLLDSAGVLEENIGDPYYDCMRELSKLPQCEDERIEGLESAIISICPSCNAHHFYSESDVRVLSEQIFVNCYQNGCKEVIMRVINPEGERLDIGDFV